MAKTKTKRATRMSDLFSASEIKQLYRYAPRKRNKVKAQPEPEPIKIEVAAQPLVITLNFCVWLHNSFDELLEENR